MKKDREMLYAILNDALKTLTVILVAAIVVMCLTYLAIKTAKLEARVQVLEEVTLSHLESIEDLSLAVEAHNRNFRRTDGTELRDPDTRD